MNKPDPFDAVEISTKRAAQNKEKRELTAEEMREIECSAERRNIIQMPFTYRIGKPRHVRTGAHNNPRA